MKNRKEIEREFGVPLAGRILEPASWTQTALKKLPEEGPLDLLALYVRNAPLIVDFGCGNGRFLIGSAVWRPQYDHLGVDILPLVLRYATRRANQRGLTNIRFAAVDAQTLVRKYLPAGSVLEAHCYHPQPFHDPRDAHRRLLTPAFLVDLQRCMKPAGRLFVQTDNAPYWQYIRAILPHCFDFTEQSGTWPDAPRGRTRREIIALRRGMTVYRGHGTIRSLTVAEVADLVRQLPLPDFDAGPRVCDLDELERGHR
jgi:tRNA (guanine-N7-)-methyltransferase